jgi:hypothetical protein
MNAMAFAMGANIALSMEIRSAHALQVCLLQLPAMVAFSAWYSDTLPVYVHLDKSIFVPHERVPHMNAFCYCTCTRSSNIVTRMLPETPCHLRGHHKAGRVQLGVASAVCKRTDALLAQVSLDHRERLFDRIVIR